MGNFCAEPMSRGGLLLQAKLTPDGKEIIKAAM